jgi:hypothetical protein
MATMFEQTCYVNWRNTQGDSFPRRILCVAFSGRPTELKRFIADTAHFRSKQAVALAR